MKDKIKEIINDLQRVADRKCYPEDILDGSIAQEWVDYITNLQDTLKDREEYCYGLETQLTNLQEENKILKELNVCVGCNNNPDYKSRIDKATNELNRIIEIIQEQSNKDKSDDLWIINRLEGIQTLLQGEYKDE